MKRVVSDGLEIPVCGEGSTVSDHKEEFLNVFKDIYYFWLRSQPVFPH